MAAGRHKQGRRAPVGKVASRHRGKRARSGSHGVARVAVPVTTAAALSVGAATVLHPASLLVALQHDAVSGSAAATGRQPDQTSPPRASALPHAGRVTLTARPSPALPPPVPSAADGRHAAPPKPAAAPSSAGGTPGRHAALEPRHRRGTDPGQAAADAPSRTAGVARDDDQGSVADHGASSHSRARPSPPLGRGSQGRHSHGRSQGRRNAPGH